MNMLNFNYKITNILFTQIRYWILYLIGLKYITGNQIFTESYLK